MSAVKDSIEEMLNGFILLQSKVEGECNFSLVKFDDQYEKAITNMPIKDVGRITLEPRGSTALLDAIGRTVDDVGAELSAMPECDRPNKVMVVVVTDGYENSSSKYVGFVGAKSSRIHNMITHQRERYQWEFVFIGADQDAIAVGSGMGFEPGKTLNYTNTTVGVRGMGMRFSNMTKSYRTCADPAIASDAVEQLCSANANTVTAEEATQYEAALKQALAGTTPANGQ
jgi:hypothetical protein